MLSALQAQSMPEDLKVYQAVLANVIQPEVDRHSAGAGLKTPAPILALNETIPMCNPNAKPQESRCISAESDLAPFEGSPRVKSLFFAELIDSTTRRALSVSFRKRNASSRAFPPTPIPNVVPFAPDQWETVFKREMARTRGASAFSVPAYSSDGHALVYATYHAYGWLVLLKHEGETWVVLEARLVWIS